MNSKIYRCGWCGNPTDADGNELVGDSFKRVIQIFLTYPDNNSHTSLTPGHCCRWKEEGHEERMQITRDMAIDAGDLNLEGQFL